MHRTSPSVHADGLHRYPDKIEFSGRDGRKVVLSDERSPMRGKILLGLVLPESARK
jgi:hypothetical protein